MSDTSPLKRIVMRLARNPGAALSEPDDHRGYALVAPLDADGALDGTAYAHHREACLVRHFAPDQEPRTGRLVREGVNWFVDYDPADDADNESVYRLREHRFTLGAYISIGSGPGEPLIYKVTAIEPVAVDA